MGYISLHADTPCFSAQFSDKWGKAPVIKQAHFKCEAVRFQQIY